MRQRRCCSFIYFSSLRWCSHISCRIINKLKIAQRDSLDDDDRLLGSLWGLDFLSCCQHFSWQLNVSIFCVDRWTFLGHTRGHLTLSLDVIFQTFHNLISFTATDHYPHIIHTCTHVADFIFWEWEKKKVRKMIFEWILQLKAKRGDVEKEKRSGEEKNI